MWRVDHLNNGTQTTFHDTEDDALAEESRIRWSGCRDVVAWFMDGLVA